MRYGVLSDIHGNLAALQAARSVIEAQDVDAYLCARDVVGYGRQPNECADLRRHGFSLSAVHSPPRRRPSALARRLASLGASTAGRSAADA